MAPSYNHRKNLYRCTFTVGLDQSTSFPIAHIVVLGVRKPILKGHIAPTFVTKKMSNIRWDRVGDCKKRMIQYIDKLKPNLLH